MTRHPAESCFRAVNPVLAGGTIMLIDCANMKMPTWMLLLTLTLSAACAQESTLFNPLDHERTDELVRLKSPPPAGPFTVTENGKPIPYQIENDAVWVCSTFPPRARHAYNIAPGKPAASNPRVNVSRTGDFHELDNGIVAIRVPATGKTGPVAGIKLDGQWVGSSTWNIAPEKLTTAVIGDGTLFGKVRLRYEFDGNGWAQIDVTVGPGWHHALIEERHEMTANAHFDVALSDGWKPHDGVSLPYNTGFQTLPAPAPNRPLLPGGQPVERPELYISLLPRWNQSCQDGWFFAATDGQRALGALVTSAGKWFWPHNNAIDVIVHPTGDYAGLRCPTWRGRRVWFLMIGPVTAQFASGTSPAAYVTRHALESLDKLNHELILDWPGATGKFTGFFPYTNDINPTGPIRGMGRTAVANAGEPGDYGTLTQAQMMMHPDCYGSYHLMWSPENPNFFSDYMKVPIAMTARLKDHPRFKELAALAESKLREDVDHSVTLPGGAGQECPGYQEHGSKQWAALSPVCRDHLGFDPTGWDRVKVSESFLHRISQPDGEIRRMLPMGDTHPKKGFGPAQVEVDRETVQSWKTAELPGFGVIFQNGTGTADETYMAFKAGPNRGHYHGDQLAFHYGASARPLAVDHHCSYGPRAGQEHMHNRVAFSTESMPWANMDGYERLIAFKTGTVAEVAVGQVESDRLRQTTRLPPEDWNAEYPQQPLAQTLTYRRTIVFVKDNNAADYFVIRDQFDGSDTLDATYCLHVRSDKADRSGQTIDFGNLTLYCAKPPEFAFDRLDWAHANGVPESTVGARLTIKGKKGEFITVLHPGKAPSIRALDNGVTVGRDEITFAIDEPVTVKRDGKEVMRLTPDDIDLNRSQGKIGLFVPNVGYPLGQIPDWLIRQRATNDFEAARALAWPLKP
jgi:hypothetical protein